MANGSLLQKKLSKRLKKKQCNSMHSPFPSNSLLGFRRTTLIGFVSAILFVFMLLGLSISSNSWRSKSTVSPMVYSIEVVNEFPHDPAALTQGLLYAGNDTLFESTGLHGKSSVRKVALQTGKVEVLQKMDKSDFGEGLTLLGERLFQVTWLEKTGFIYNINDLIIGTQVVKYKGLEVSNLNELEFVNGKVWANVWMTDCIVRIITEDGSVVEWILLPALREGLVRSGIKGIDVLNGIAWDSERNRIFVTGKLWPKLFEIKLIQPKKLYDDVDIKRLCLRDAFHFN